MASFITDTLDRIDSAIASYAQSVFTGVSSEVNTVLVAAGLVGLALIAVNSILAFSTVSMRSYITWSVRYIIVLAVATSWSQFQPIYDIITDVPQNYGGALLSAAGAGVSDNAGLNAAMDDMVTSIFNYSDQMNEESGWLGISISAVLLMVLGAIMAFIAIAISAIGKIGLALFVSIAPLAIGALAFNGTRQLFESWSRATIGVALIPLVLAGIMGAVIGVGRQIMNTTPTATELSDIAGFVIVSLAAIFMMKNVPSYATGLAGSVVAVGTGVADAIRMSRTAASAAASPVTAAYSAAARMDAGRQAAAGVQERGGSRSAQMAAFITQASRMSRDRQRYSDLSYMRGPSGSPSVKHPKSPKNPPEN
ncbi:type IV secretion system protein [Roseibium sediminicola]|uniref:Type IV secretion system protein n=1 Tax=Roseibium sediminicola TaxID=2933272 RepID=A0ABT0H546_9HYPH|nr:type IV secretion system protein [Roseibium sp. CAU 1639]MCK7616213.1 type IV secretion system protein [Roseibium sp. CAU 1639]